MWPGGPSGVPRIKRVVQTLISEWGTRFAILQAGDAENVAVPPANRPQADAFVGEICDYIDQRVHPTTDNPDGTAAQVGRPARRLPHQRLYEL